ncbi:hypothetical protein SAMN05216267_100115 [Actinacidiphila rubida]|uniref:Uncharacterized protein n=2 Tax=Actinacidiphila rubida TaxID=310780 RepID=A0A1H8DB48_9ACTN|nr:hypothetical protein SAMN05216267_100115 [Actinacidiphila rubida]
MALLPGIEELGEGSFLVEAQESGGTIGWVATADEGSGAGGGASGGAGWGAVSSSGRGKPPGRYSKDG